MVVEMGRRFMFLTLGLVSLLALGACGSSDTGGGASTQTGTVSGQVASKAGGSAVAGATVSTLAGTTTTATDGSFTVPAPVGDRSVIHVEASGFAEAFPVTRVSPGQTATLGVTLLPTGVSKPINVANGGVVTVPNSTAQVEILPDGLVPTNGGAAAGTVTVAVTPINPADNPALMPGDFTGVPTGGGSPGPIESFGAMLIDIRDSAGTRYMPVPGKPATIRIPLGTRSATPPTTVPLYFFDETTGLWNQDGTATLQGTGSNRFYQGPVTRFRYWNADIAFETVFVTGCVQDANGQRVANALVETNGIDYSGTAAAVTAADGTFRVGIRKSGKAKLGQFDFDRQTFKLTARSNIVEVGPSAVDVSLSDCLTSSPGPVTITTVGLPEGKVGVVYNQILAATGGSPGYVWSLSVGSNPLPAGLMLNPAGVITGAPTVAAVGTTTITVKVMDAAGGTDTQALNLTITAAVVVAPPITITSPSPLSAGTVGVVYDESLVASGGTGNKSWSVASGALPDGLKLDASTGAISGKPLTAGTSTFTIKVQDSANPPQSAQKQLRLTINPVPGGGTLMVTGAPANVDGTFVQTVPVETQDVLATDRIVTWFEVFPGNPHTELVQVNFATTTNQILRVRFVSLVNLGEQAVWVCIGPGLPIPVTCSGVTMNRAAGTLTLANTVLSDASVSGVPPITLNGTLRFTPF